MNILKELSDKRRADAESRQRAVPMDEMMRRAAAAPAPRDFAAAFQGDRSGVIAELKRASPSEGMIRDNFRPVELARELETSGAAALSVLCEPHRFLGDESYLVSVRQATSLPLLYKDFLTTRYQIAAARAAGADAVLLIAAILDDSDMTELLGFANEIGIRALVETHSAEEIRRAVRAGAGVIGVNCRDLRNFSTDVSLLERLLGEIPRPCIRIAESGMRDVIAVAKARVAGADGFLVGTALMRAESPGEMLKEMLGIV